MSQSYDGNFSTARQNGAKQVILPLQEQGNYRATLVRRNYIASPATAYAPEIGTLTGYTSRLTYSDDLSNAAWTKAQATGTASAATDPEGGSTASKLAEDNTNNVHTATQAMTVASGAIAFGVLAKAAERSFIRLRVNNGTDGNLAIAVFNLGTIKRLLNGWFWCSVTGTATVANSSCIFDLTSDGTTFSYTGTTGSGIYLWRASAYLASAAGPLIATTATTRAVTAPPIDADDPLAFLVMEQEPDVSMLEMGVARWSREYANVPAPVITYSSVSITKPEPSSQCAAVGFWADNTGASSTFQAYFYNTGVYFLNNEAFGIRKNCTSVGSGSDTRITCAGHGIVGTETILASKSHNSLIIAQYRFTAGQYSVIDANTIDLLGLNLTNEIFFLANYLRSYTPGVARLGSRVTDTYYLPGFTPGIVTASDIPIPSPAINDAQMFALVAGSATGFQTYDADPIQFWRAPIYVQRVIDIDVDDL
jgi:hypothetical protein